MARHTNNNSHHNQVRELQYEDELQGYDIQNAKRSKKKKVNKKQDTALELFMSAACKNKLYYPPYSLVCFLLFY